MNSILLVQSKKSILLISTILIFEFKVADQLVIKFQVLVKINN